MQESSHKDVKLQIYDGSCRSFMFAIHGRWIPAVHAGMTAFFQNEIAVKIADNA